jgi:ATP-dependent DNA helicase RecQ/Werner syndrome ATP-dependent helicase
MQASPQGLKRPLGFGYQGVDPSQSPSSGTVEHSPVPLGVLKTLQNYFGFNAFRAEQQQVIQEAIAGRDTAVFWATGSGKSMCYQIPALHLGKIVVVVSPLISLMVDQVAKFNATAGAAQDGPRACFLGSAQVDPQVESDALRGCYKLVYVTPEKLATSFLDRLKTLHQNGGIAMLAIDEAHCISEWGHDFRPTYREVSRARVELPGLPVMALTATAVPRVQEDILAQLGMKNPVISRSSFDRPNLRLACTRKQTRALDFNKIATMIIEGGGSTIVYVPTQGDTDTVATFLSDHHRLQSAGIQVRSYHAGKYAPDREAAHLDFLSGRAQVIVATVAFGMGIDKPDIRRIVHYGPPKTVEEYFQQVGRAGRDGLSADCVLISNDSDFNNYASEFYTKGLTLERKEQQLKSTEALRGFAAGCGCRRHWLLEYFGEKAGFGNRCGTCDTCISSASHENDLSRDFSVPAAVIFEAIASTEDYPQAMTTLMAIITGSYKPKNPNFASEIRRTEAVERIKRMKVGMPPLMCREPFMKEMISMLCHEGYLERQRRSSEVGGGSYTANWEVYIRTAKGREATGGKTEVRLRVPEVLRQQEQEEMRRTELKRQELVKGGVDLRKIPVNELERGEGKTIDAHLTWTRRLVRLRGTQGAAEKASKLEEFLSQILLWRDAVAQKLRMAPAAVLSEELVLNLAYSQPTSVDALKAAGVRIVNVDELATLMQTLTKELFPKEGGGAGSSSTEVDGPRGSSEGSAAMLLPEGPWQAPMKWEKAVYKVGKNGQLPAWELYYNRWFQGDHPQAIAMNPPSGKAVQVGTVAGHVLTALTHGKVVHLQLLAKQCDLIVPNQEEWNQMEEGAAVRGQNVDADDFKAREVLCGILGPENVNMEPSEKSEQAKALEAKWYDRLRWWVPLRRVRFPVKFETANDMAKRQRSS